MYDKSNDSFYEKNSANYVRIFKDVFNVYITVRDRTFNVDKS